jgi:dipeptidyl aminopeptidase/acylaminoacyl peptidase
MNKETLREVAWIGDIDLRGSVRGVLLCFHGLGFAGEKTANDEMEKQMAQAGYLVIFPYYGPWCWSNRVARRLVNDIVHSVFREWDLPEGTPILSTGGSMGGQGALIHARYAEKPVAGVAVIYPVCDMKYHYIERPDLPRSMRNAFYAYPEYPDMDTILTEQSPLAQAKEMPKVPYLFVHGANDVQVHREYHSDVMVPALREHGCNVTYFSLEDLAHGGVMPSDVVQCWKDFLLSFIEPDVRGQNL